MSEHRCHRWGAGDQFRRRQSSGVDPCRHDEPAHHRTGDCDRGDRTQVVAGASRGGRRRGGSLRHQIPSPGGDRAGRGRLDLGGISGCATLGARGPIPGRASSGSPPVLSSADCSAAALASRSELGMSRPRKSATSKESRAMSWFTYPDPRVIIGAASGAVLGWLLGRRAGVVGNGS